MLPRRGWISLKKKIERDREGGKKKKMNRLSSMRKFFFSAEWLLRMHVVIFPSFFFSLELITPPPSSFVSNKHWNLCIRTQWCTHTHTHTQGAIFDWQSVTFGLFNFSFKVNAAPHGAHIRPLTGWWCGEMVIACVYDHQKLVQGSGTQKLFQIQFGVDVDVVDVVTVLCTRRAKNKFTFFILYADTRVRMPYLINLRSTRQPDRMLSRDMCILSAAHRIRPMNTISLHECTPHPNPKRIFTSLSIYTNV